MQKAADLRTMVTIAYKQSDRAVY